MSEPTEVERLRQWVADLQSGMYVNCVYCGHRYGPRETTPVSMADALKAHVEQCPDHPMSHLKARLAEWERAALRALAGIVPTPAEGYGAVGTGPGQFLADARRLRELVLVQAPAPTGQPAVGFRVEAAQVATADPKPLTDMTEPELRDYFSGLARLVEGHLPSGPSAKGKALFVLLVFDESCIGQYISNAERAGIIKTLRETADRLARREDVRR